MVGSRRGQAHPSALWGAGGTLHVEVALVPALCRLCLPGPGFPAPVDIRKWPELTRPLPGADRRCPFASPSPLPVGVPVPRRAPAQGCLLRRGGGFSRHRSSLVGWQDPLLQGRPVQNPGMALVQESTGPRAWPSQHRPAQPLLSSAGALGLAPGSQRPHLCRLVPLSVPSGWLASIITLAGPASPSFFKATGLYRTPGNCRACPGPGLGPGHMPAFLSSGSY